MAELLSTVLAVAKLLVGTAAIVGSLILLFRRKSLSVTLELGAEKAQKTGDTSDVESLFGGPPPDSK